MLPLLYLHGLSTGDFVPALGQFLGSSKGLSASTITRLTETWRAEARAFAETYPLSIGSRTTSPAEPTACLRSPASDRSPPW